MCVCACVRERETRLMIDRLAKRKRKERLLNFKEELRRDISLVISKERWVKIKYYYYERKKDV